LIAGLLLSREPQREPIFFNAMRICRVPKEQTAETVPTISLLLKKVQALSTPSTWHFFGMCAI